MTEKNKKQFIEILQEENDKLKFKVRKQQEDIDCLRQEIEELQTALEIAKRRRTGIDLDRER